MAADPTDWQRFESMTDEERQEKFRSSGLQIWIEPALHVAQEYYSGPYGGFAVLPLGLRINRDIEEAETGSAIEFSGGERARVLSVKRVKCNDPMTSGLAWVRYGLNVKDLRERWRREAVYAGSGVKAVDMDECLVLFYKRKEG